MMKVLECHDVGCGTMLRLGTMVLGGAMQSTVEQMQAV